MSAQQAAAFTSLLLEVCAVVEWGGDVSREEAACPSLPTRAKWYRGGVQCANTQEA